MKKNSLFVLFILVLASFGLAACAPGSLPTGGQAFPSVQNAAIQSAIAEGEFTGLVSAIAPNQWTIADNPVLVNEQTVIDETITVGDTARVHTQVDSNGVILASKIEAVKTGGSDDAQATLEAPPGANEQELVGLVETIAADAWTISGQVIGITAQTEIMGNIKVGDMVKVHVFTAADNTLTAREIELVDQLQGTETPEAGNPDSSNKAGEMEFFGLVQVMDPGMWTVSGTQFSVTAETEIKDPIAVGDSVKVHATLGTDGSLFAREIELANKLQSAETPQAGTGTVEFTGMVEGALANGWTISGRTVLVTAGTEVKDAFGVGDQVKVEARVNADGTLSASEIGKVDAASGSNSGSGSSDDNPNDNSNSGSNSGSGKPTKSPDDNSGKSGGGKDDGGGHK
jgi:protein involved in polysaccharide export with SLBB domain